MWVRQLVGGWAGQVIDLPIPEAQAGLAAGTLALPEEPVRVKGLKVPGEGKPAPSPEPTQESAPPVSTDKSATGDREDEIRAVIAMASTKGVAFQKFRAEARKFLGEDTPAGKDDVVAALKALLQGADQGEE